MVDRFISLFKASAGPVLDVPRIIKRSIAIIVDVCLCVVATWLAFYLRLGEFVDFERMLAPSLASSIIAIPVFTITGLYNAVLRYAGWYAVSSIARAVILYGVFFGTLTTVIVIDGTPRTLGFIQPLVLFFGLAGSRLLARFWLGGTYRSRLEKNALQRAVIYGAGAAGMELAVSLSRGREFKVIGFIDDDENLRGRTLHGLKISTPDSLYEIIRSGHVTHVLLAMPSVNRRRRKQIIEKIAKYGVIVRTLPSAVELADGRISINDVKELDFDDLLGRDVVEPDPTLMAKNISGKVVLVTGAGGSIGSEICRQIILYRPQKLLMLEISEAALYSIHHEIESMKSIVDNIRVVPLICSVQDARNIREIVALWKPDTIYHAAAYKHVPMVEQNVVAAIRNNVFGTKNIAQAAIDLGVESFVLVSTDKAVRPTNVMGATKRLSEMVLQALVSESKSSTCLSMVRFGNVIASSGSVIPKFKHQIAMGGPITVTHPEINRFFMTIPEAATLVIQAGAMADSGDVFVLDMGEPIKIIDLARRMILLSGLTEKNSSNPSGDIAIKISGLRPGEKLYEELLIGNNPERTHHPKIMRANETYTPWGTLALELEILGRVVESNDVPIALSMLKDLVNDFSPDGSLVDWMYTEQNHRDKH